MPAVPMARRALRRRHGQDGAGSSGRVQAAGGHRQGDDRRPTAEDVSGRSARRRNLAGRLTDGPIWCAVMTRSTQSAPEARLREIVWSCSWMRSALEAARDVAAPDWLIGAGAIRRLVWDRLHGVTEPALPDDLDLVFFDQASLRPEREDQVRSAL